MSDIFLDSSRDEILRQLRMPHAQNIIFGAGRFGRIVLKAARILEVPVAAFCDNNPALQGREVDGVIVLSPDDAFTRYPSALFFIALYVTYSVLPWIRKNGLTGRCLSLNIVEKAFSEDFTGIPGDIAVFLRRTALAQNEVNSNGALTLNTLSLTVTDYCSLNCRDCSVRVPYIRIPRHRTAENLLADLDAFLGFAEHVHQISLVGGDGMTHPGIDYIAEQAAAREKVDKVVIFSNAIVPVNREKWVRLGRGKISFHVTDYGNSRQRIADFVRELSALKINCLVHTLEVWNTFHIGGAPHPDPERNRHTFQSCISSVCANLIDGRLYRCPLVPNAVREGLIPDDGDNYLSLSTLSATSDHDKVNAVLRAFLYEKETMAACAYCTGFIRGESPEVAPGIQIPD